MLEITEFLEIDKIEQLRIISGAELDEYDNFSWHIALKDDGKLLGTARFYRQPSGDIFIDRPYLYRHDDAHFEMLTRTLLLKAQTLGDDIYVVAQNKPEIYQKYGFKLDKGSMRMLAKDIIFPKSCGGGCKQV